MRRVLYSVQKKDGTPDEDASKERLSSLLERVIIHDSAKDVEKKYKDLMSYAKVTTDNLRETYINSLLGFIIKAGTDSYKRNGTTINDIPGGT